jgi:UDP-glucose 4-epimerase
MKKVLVTGCAGFVGSNMVDDLLSKKNQVIGIDNLSTGKKFFLNKALKNKNFKFYKRDLKYYKSLIKIFKDCEVVYHFAANADIKNGLLHPQKDLKENTIVTSNVLEAMRKSNVRKIVFSSTGSVYGEPRQFPTKENTSFPIQTSLYGSSKSACESLITSYCYGFGFKAYIFRFVSLFGKRYTHGHLYDFYKQLKKNKKILKVLGNGLQKKSYLNISDCINAINFAMKFNNTKNINIYNLGLNKYISVRQSIKYILKYLNLKPKIFYGNDNRGWIGDSPKIFLDISKIKKTGWKPTKSIKQSIWETLNYFEKNKWLFK